MATGSGLPYLVFDMVDKPHKLLMAWNSLVQLNVREFSMNLGQCYLYTLELPVDFLVREIFRLCCKKVCILCREILSLSFYLGK